MHAVALSLLALGFVGQSSALVTYCGSLEPNSLLVVVTERHCDCCGCWCVCPAHGADVQIFDDTGHPLLSADQKHSTDSCGNLLFRDQNLARFRFLTVHATKGTLTAPDIKANWRLVMDHPIELHPSAEPSDKTLRPAAPRPDTPSGMTSPYILPADDGAIDSARLSDSDGIIRLSVSVPQDAVVLINGRKTSKTGTHREYFSSGLNPSLTYKYIVRAEVLRGGKRLEGTQTLSLSPGDSKSLALDFPIQKVASAVSAR
jgi:uncharacterized protein (TIGR03000 family)